MWEDQVWLAAILSIFPFTSFLARSLQIIQCKWQRRDRNRCLARDDQVRISEKKIVPLKLCYEEKWDRKSHHVSGGNSKYSVYIDTIANIWQKRDGGATTYNLLSVEAPPWRGIYLQELCKSHLREKIRLTFETHLWWKLPPFFPNRRHLLKLNIFYESLSTEVTTKKPAYDILAFGCR